MVDDTARLKTKISALTRSLDELETVLEPLFAQSLPETLLPLETIQQAKLQVAIPYLVYDLVFIYLKTRGVDPRTHPVIAELERIKQYFDKIKNAEDPAKRTLAVDKAAAGRFIKHAISQARAAPIPPAPGPSTHLRFDDNGTPHDVRVPLKVTEKMLAREQYLKELKEADDTDEMEEDLELYNEEVPEVVSNTRGDTKGKGKAQAFPSTTPEADASRPAAERKRRRPVIDPFAGYEDETPARSGSFAKRAKTPGADESEDIRMVDDSAISSGTGINTPRTPSSASANPKGFSADEVDSKLAKKAAKKKKSKSKLTKS